MVSEAYVVSTRRHRAWMILAACASLLTASCGGGGGGGGASSSPPSSPASQPNVRAVSQSDSEIAQMVYGLAERTPAGFYADPSVDGYQFVATSHLKNTDIEPSLHPSAASFELCTDDWNEALSWSETSAQSATQYADLVVTDEEERFFEFGRVRTGEPVLYQRQRVYKCSYLQRDMANLRESQGPAGVFGVAPPSADDLRLLSEYLWTFTIYNNLGHAALRSVGSSSAGALSHTIYTASLERSGYSASCDRIDVFAWTHAVDIATGELQLSITDVFSFGARENAGVVEMCTAQ